MCSTTERRVFLVTGCAGFIGGAVVNELLKCHEDVMVVGIDNLAFCDEKRSFREVEVARMLGIETSYERQFKYYLGSVCNEDLMEKIFSNHNITHVSHQAAVASVPRSMESPQMYSYNNMHGFMVLLQNVKKHSPDAKVIFASSSAAKGDATGALLSPYALSKQVNEQTCEMFARIFDIKCYGVRYFNVYGLTQRVNDAYSAVIPRFFEAANKRKSLVIFGDGNQTRAFTYIDDVVKVNIKLLLHMERDDQGGLKWGKSYDFGNGRSVTINHLSQCVTTAMNAQIATMATKSPSAPSKSSSSSTSSRDVSVRHVAERCGDIRYSQVTNSEISTAIGINTFVSIEDGVSSMSDHLNSVRDTVT
jgi:UDP-N-acetylglucosamine 4-epimerase